MNLEDIGLIYEYNDWANQLILDTAAQVTPEQLVAPTAFSYGNLRGTLVHILDAEIGWRCRLEDTPYLVELSEADFPTLESVRERWTEEEKAFRAYRDSLTDEDLNSVIRYPVDNGVIRERVIWHCLYHVVNHGMQHRSESAAMLTDYGHSPGDIDFTVFLNWRNAKMQGKTG